MTAQDLSGAWSVFLEDGTVQAVSLPGTLDTNGIGEPDEGRDLVSPVIRERLRRRHVYTGKAGYLRQVRLSKEVRNAVLSGERLFLYVEKSRFLTVKWNGRDLSPLTPGSLSTPWIFELTDVVTTGEKDVQSLYAVCNNRYPEGASSGILASGDARLNWNGLVGKILLVTQKQNFIAGACVLTEPTGSLIVQVRLEVKTAFHGTVKAESDTFTRSFEESLDLEAGTHVVTFDVREQDLAPGVLRWDIGEGNLQTLTVSATGCEEKSFSFGIRTLWNDKDGHFLLNGRTIFLFADTFHGLFPHTGYEPCDKNTWKEILSRLQSYGINCVRFDSHCPPDAAFDAADELGLMLLVELTQKGTGHAFETEDDALFWTQLRQILLFEGGHPSFCFLTLGSQIRYTKKGLSRAAEMLQSAKSEVPSCLYSTGSDVFGGALGPSRVDDFFLASGFDKGMLRLCGPGMTGALNRGNGNPVTYDEVVKRIRTEYDGPVVTFEAGGYAILPQRGEAKDYESDVVDADAEAFAERESDRLSDPAVRENLRLSGASMALSCLREETISCLATDSLAGICYAGLVDDPEDAYSLFGMLNAHFQPKEGDFAKPEVFRTFCREVSPLLFLPGSTFLEGTSVHLYAAVANFGRTDIRDSWKIELVEMTPDGTKRQVIRGRHQRLRAIALDEAAEDSGSLATCPAGCVTMLGDALLALPVTGKARIYSVVLTIGSFEVSRKIFLYPRTQTATDVLMTGSVSQALQALSMGARVLLSPRADLTHFADSIQVTFTPDFRSCRTHPDQDGFTSLYIHNRSAAFSDFPTDTVPGEQWRDLMQDARAMGVPKSWQAGSLVDAAGAFDDPKARSVLVEARCGSGRLVLCSLGILEKQESPVVRAFTESLLHFLSSKDFAPSLAITGDELQRVVR